jgi:prefoldin alpha subunit
MEKEQQELMFKLSVFEQQIQQVQQQLQAVEQGILEMNSLNLGLDELVGSTGKEILAPIGRGIFAKTKLLSEDLTVDVGEKKFVKKTIPETKKIIEEQIKKLEDVYKQLTKSLNDLNDDLEKVMTEAQEKGKKVEK